MADKIIAPRRSETLTQGGVGLLRFIEYLERMATQVNGNTDIIDLDLSVNISSASIAAVNKLVNQLQNDTPVNNSAQVNTLSKRISDLEKTIDIASLYSKVNQVSKQINDISALLSVNDSAAISALSKRITALENA